eukprot:jgi/Ulvmu1/6904/UM031_0111.1
MRGGRESTVELHAVACCDRSRTQQSRGSMLWQKQQRAVAKHHRCQHSAACVVPKATLGLVPTSPATGFAIHMARMPHMARLGPQCNCVCSTSGQISDILPVCTDQNVHSMPRLQVYVGVLCLSGLSLTACTSRGGCMRLRCAVLWSQHVRQNVVS